MPSHLSLVLVYFKLVLLSCFYSQYIAGGGLGNETDQLALLEFKAKIINDPLGVLNSWNHTVHFCQWHGVTCGHRHQRVVALKLDSSRLMGSISPHLGNLSFLRLLNLSNNIFGHEVPQQLWGLGRLQQLLLSDNSISGVLPSNLSCSSRFQRLVLRNNKLIGEIPPSLGNLSSLISLNLGANNLTGVIPESLGQIKNLTLFSVEENLLSGSIPPAIFNLSQMRVFTLLDNQFHGSLPPELGTSMPYLEFFSVARNKFTGRIPHSTSNATNLIYLEINGNRFTGSLPPLHKLDNLMSFVVADNQIGSGGDGELISLCSLVNATRLERLDLSGNNFGGVMPTCIGNLFRHFRVLALEMNKLWGQIPSTIGNLDNLEWISVYENQLSGSIPSNIGSLKKLQYLFLDNNNLSGNIPSSFGDLRALIRLTVNDNNLNGSLAPSLGKCENLLAFDASGNKLEGSVPPQLFLFAPFSIGINLSYNLLTGDFPLEVENLKQIGALDVARNSLSGEIPRSIGACASLEYLDMSGNLFQGIIPHSLATLRGLTLLDLSDNNLTGEIPRFLAFFKLLETLNLSHNNFEGIVPSEGIFSNKSALFLDGNKKLCGGIPELHLPKCSLHQHQPSMVWKRIILITSLTLGVTSVLLVILSCRLRRKRNKSRSGEVEAPQQFVDLSHHALFKATNGFSGANLIGVGSFGSVYKGVLEQGRKLVAIKVLNLLRQGAYKSFITECKALKNVRHRNLVKMLTVCSSVDQHGNDFKALISELMSNGSVDEWLHKGLEFTCSNQSPRVLTLLQRLNIVIDVACALDYLHNDCTTPIVHCDLKPSNVLLDDNMTAHLSDFGLAKFLPAIASGTSSICIRGTVGYTAPEYGLGNEISTYGDVYGYGVLLLEVFTGKRPTDEMFQDGLNLHQFAKDALPEHMWEIIDPILLRENQESRGLRNIAAINKDSKMFCMIQECLIVLIGIGVACCAELPRERMNMSDVVAQLGSIKDKLFQAGA